MAIEYACDMETKDGLGVWGYRHYVVYLASLVRRVHPRLPSHLEKAVEEFQWIALRDAPRDVAHLRFTPTMRKEGRHTGKQRLAGLLVLDLCDIVRCWWHASLLVAPLTRADEKKSRHYYEDAKSAALRAERRALDAGVSMDALLRCATLAFKHWNDLDQMTNHLQGRQLSDDDRQHRDAALAAMDAEHYDVAYDILTRDRKG